VLAKMSEYPDISNPKATKDKFLIQSVSINETLTRGSSDFADIWKQIEAQHKPKENKYTYVGQQVKCKLLIPTVKPQTLAATLDSALSHSPSHASTTGSSASHLSSSLPPSSSSVHPSQFSSANTASSFSHPPATSATLSASSSASLPNTSSSLPPSSSSLVPKQITISQEEYDKLADQSKHYVELLSHNTDLTLEYKQLEKQSKDDKQRLIDMDDEKRQLQQQLEKSFSELELMSKNTQPEGLRNRFPDSKSPTNLSDIDSSPLSSTTTSLTSSTSSTSSSSSNQEASSSIRDELRKKMDTDHRELALSNRNGVGVQGFLQLFLFGIVCFILGRIF